MSKKINLVCALLEKGQLTAETTASPLDISTGSVYPLLEEWIFWLIGPKNVAYRSAANKSELSTEIFKKWDQDPEAFWRTASNNPLANET